MGGYEEYSMWIFFGSIILKLDYFVGSFLYILWLFLMHQSFVSTAPQPRGIAGLSLKSEKSLSPLIPVGGGAVDRNDWCIRSRYGMGIVFGVTKISNIF